MEKAVSEDQNLITYCGLYCGDCYGYTGKIADLARDLRKELRGTKYAKFATFMATLPFGKSFQHYPECYKLLGQMLKFRCHKGCRNGGGPPFCKMRKCCQKKGFDGCWQCGEFESCEKLDFLKPVHDDAHIKNLTAIKRKGTVAFIRGKRYW
ncbi:DUF3795 domain-containing protein [Chloroflexota bacterium]